MKKTGSERKTWILHRLACTAGGFTGGYIVLKTGLFANAQTLNMLSMVTASFDRQWHKLILFSGALVLYASAVFLCVVIQKKTSFDTKRVSLLISSAGLLFYTFIPMQINGYAVLYPSFFMMSLQWVAFSEAYHGFNSSTIFSTNNLRQTVYSLGEYLFDRDPSQLERGLFFLGSLLFFHLGVLSACISVKLFAGKGAAIGLIPIFCAYAETFSPDE